MGIQFQLHASHLRFSFRQILTLKTRSLDLNENSRFAREEIFIFLLIQNAKTTEEIIENNYGIKIFSHTD